MGFDWLPKCSRVCAQTGRELHVGETCFSALLEDQEGRIVRSDYSAEVWSPPSDRHFLGWWSFTIPDEGESRVRLAPNDILMELFDRWVVEPLRAEELYVLTLLLLRRRVFRYEGGGNTEEGKELLLVYSPRREMTYSIPVTSLTGDRISQIQQELADLLYSGDSPGQADKTPENATEITDRGK